jgi:rubrerythrin
MQPTELLNHLIAVDFDAIEAYEAAIGRLGSTPDAAQLARFLDDHKRHIVELSAMVRELGGEPAGHGDLKHFVSTGKVVLGGLIGDDAILRAMRSNEGDACAAYDNGALREGLELGPRTLILRILEDERRHREWFEQRLDVSPRDPVIDPVLMRPV